MKHARRSLAEYTRPKFIEAIGQHATFLDFQEKVSRVAAIERPVLLLGERGTGKELAVQRLHFLSPRWQQPLITLNCAALPPTLIEAELFGYEEGAFTGADKRRAGRFETADGGTLFLDEIGKIPLEVQQKILRVIEYGVLERIGSPEPVQVDVRIVGATNVDIRKLVDANQFLPDLLDRLAFEVLYVPPLHQRGEDILLLAHHFAARMAHELGRDEVPELTEEAIEALETYLWPGNVRELKNVIERAVFRAEDNIISEICFDPFEPPEGVATPNLAAPEEEPAGTAPLDDDADETNDLDEDLALQLVDLDTPIADASAKLEIGYLRKALERTRHNQRKAAELLGLTYHQFRGLYRKHRESLLDEADDE